MSEINIMPSLSVSASALSAQNQRMRIIAENLANAQTTRTADGTPYQRKDIAFSSELGRKIGGRRGDASDMKGVHAEAVVDDQTPMKRIHRPGHPHADEEGYVTLPNVNPMEEMVDLMVANRSYEANIAAIKTSRSITQKALEIGK